MSATKPHRIDPATVPDSAANGTSEAVARDTPYSLVMPDRVKPSAAGFMTSITNATISAPIMTQCDARNGASCSPVTVICVNCRRNRIASPGSNP